jgi:hypothetical protein
MNCEQLLPDEIVESPELLILAVLDTTLWSLQLVLIGTLPELVDDFAEKRADPRARAAKQLSRRATDLTKAIERYRKVLRSERAPPPDPADRYF